MKVIYNSKKADLVFELEAQDVKQVFDQVAHIQEVFEPERCGACNSTQFKLSKRDVSKGNKTYVYREIVCTKCYSRLSLGQKQADQSLFPQRKDKNDKVKGQNGWYKFEEREDAEE